MKKSLVANCLLLALLAGCRGVSSGTIAQVSEPTPTSTKTFIPTSTPTEAPISLLLPTARPLPTSTPEPQPCAEQSAEFVTQTNELLREWDDTLKLAENTARNQLPSQIEKLQALGRRAEDLPAPDCALPMRAVLIDAINVATRSMVIFMTKPDLVTLAVAGLDSSRNDLDIVRHALAVLTDSKDSWQPLMVNDVKKALPQYTWRDETNATFTSIVAESAPVTIVVLHKNGVVYKIQLEARMDYNPNHKAAWEIIAPTASTLLPNWAERDSWLAEFGANTPNGDLSKTEYADVTTIVASYSANAGAPSWETINLHVYFPHK